VLWLSLPPARFVSFVLSIRAPSAANAFPRRPPPPFRHKPAPAKEYNVLPASSRRDRQLYVNFPEFGRLTLLPATAAPLCTASLYRPQPEQSPTCSSRSAPGIIGPRGPAALWRPLNAGIVLDASACTASWLEPRHWRHHRRAGVTIEQLWRYVIKAVAPIVPGTMPPPGRAGMNIRRTISHRPHWRLCWRRRPAHRRTGALHPASQPTFCGLIRSAGLLGVFPPSPANEAHLLGEVAVETWAAPSLAAMLADIDPRRRKAPLSAGSMAPRRNGAGHEPIGPGEAPRPTPPRGQPRAAHTIFGLSPKPSCGAGWPSAKTLGMTVVTSQVPCRAPRHHHHAAWWWPFFMPNHWLRQLTAALGW
jgi:hypothetical protein